jgi:putative phosphoribosyl transferase
MFSDRHEAGRRLAQQLTAYAGRNDVVVLGLPPGGVPVASEVARVLEAPLDVFVVRKLGLPQQPPDPTEAFAIGSVASGGAIVLDEEIVRSLRVSPPAVAAVIAKERAELARREREYRGDRPAMPLRGRIVIVVDDVLATDSSVRAAVKALRGREPARIVVAVPVGAPEASRALEAEADEVVCLLTPRTFHVVGTWFGDFTQTSDGEVRRLLVEAAERRESNAHAVSNPRRSAR